MFKNYFVMLMAVILMSVSLVACGQKKAESPKEAIEVAKTMSDVKAQANYLVAQAENFYKTEQYKEAVEVANHILKNIDKESEKAKKLLEKAKADLKEQASGMLNSLKQ